MKANAAKTTERVNNTESAKVHTENVQVTNNVPESKPKRHPSELNMQKAELSAACKETCKGFREYQRELNVIVNQINEYAKIEGNKAREFFTLCGISIAPKDSKKRDTKRVYLNTELVIAAYSSEGLIADQTTKKLYKLEVPEGCILRKVTNKDTQITTFVQDTNLTATKVLNILCRAQKKVLESVAKQKQMQRIAEKKAAKKAAKEASKKAEKSAANIAA